MAQQGMYDRVRRAIVAELGVEEARITPDSRLDEDLGLDSLDRVDLVMAIEEEFGVDIEDEEWERVETVGDILRLLDGAQAARAF